MIDATVHVVGATGRSGLALCRALLDRGTPIAPVVRNVAKWRASGIDAEPRVADLNDSFDLRRALKDATRIASCAHARHTGKIIDASADDARLVLLGSTRRFTRWLDAHGIGVLEGETALLGSGRPGVMLHPTMIYGAQGENNVQRLAALLKRLPVVPLPDGGRALIQPIYQDDVTKCVISALDIAWREPTTLVIAGPTPLAYADFVRAVARAARLRPPRIVSIPVRPMMALAPLTSLLPFVPRIGADEVRRLCEDRAFPVGPMFTTLGVRPIPLDEGLSRIW